MYHDKRLSRCISYLCGLLQGLHGEGQVTTLAQVVIVHALGHLGDRIIAGQALHPTAAQSPTSILYRNANKVMQTSSSMLNQYAGRAARHQKDGVSCATFAVYTTGII